MSQQQPDNELSGAETEQQPVEETPALPREDKPAPAQEPEQAQPRSPRRGRGLAPLALLVAAASLAASGWMWRAWQQGQSELQQLAARASGQEQQLQGSVGQLRRELERVDAGRAALEGSRQDTFQDIAGLSQRLSNLERQMAEFQGVSEETRRRWIVAEVEYYLQIANARIQLARDVNSALSALRLADGRLSRLDDPGLLEVRRKIRSEMTELDAVALPDTQGIALGLGSLAVRIGELPLARTLAATREAASAASSQAQGWDRAVSRAGEVFKGIVTVRRTHEQATPLLATSEEYFLRRNLELKIESARLALLSGDQTSYRESLRSARSWISDYFDTGAATTVQVLEALAELELQDIRPVLPDISGSLGLLRAMPPAGGL